MVMRKAALEVWLDFRGAAGDIPRSVIALAREQLQQADAFDYVVENDDLDRAVQELTELVRGLLAPAGTMSRP